MQIQKRNWNMFIKLAVLFLGLLLGINGCAKLPVSSESTGKSTTAATEETSTFPHNFSIFGVVTALDTETKNITVFSIESRETIVLVYSTGTIVQNKYGDDIKIINVDCLTYAGNLENLKGIDGRDNYTFVRADICDKEAISRIFADDDIDYVIHFAAESHVDRSIKNPEVFIRTNVLGTAVMLNCAKASWELADGSFKEGKKFVHISTDEVYGALPDDDTLYFYETTPIDPHSPYSASKASSDMLVKSYVDTYKFPANITNCSNNYGPYQFPEKLIPLIINNALHGKKLPVYGDGKNVRDWLYVRDHAKAIDMVTRNGKPGERYNIGGHNEKQNIEIIGIIIDTLREMLPDGDPRKALVTRELITYVEDRKGHDRRYAIAPDKIKEDIGWYPETMFKDGIRLTIRWYFENEDWMKNVTSGDYQKYYDEMYNKLKQNGGI